ncbi:MAG: CPBP family intramembrane glutamic endopeptidase [Calditrichia bacterium]
MKNKFLAILEVIGVLVIGWTLTRILVTALGVPPLQEYLDKAILSDNPDFLYLSKIGFLTLLIQFLCLMIPAYIITKLLHKGGLKSFGITTGNKPLKETVLTGFVLFCLLGIPMKLLLIANHFTNLGMIPSYWEVFNKDWNVGFWIFMAVGSYAVIPVFEELFYRGYAQFRLEKEFKFFAILFISLLFTLSHFQYFIPDMFNIGMLFSLFLLAIGMAFSRYLNVSIIAPIVIHSLMNIPLKYPYDLFVLAAMILGLVILRKRVAKLITDSIDESKNTNYLENSLFLIIILAFALGMNFTPEITLIAFIFLFIVSLIVQILSKRGHKVKATDNS